MRPPQLGWRGALAAALALAAVGAAARELAWLAGRGSGEPFVESEEERVRRELAIEHADCHTESKSVHQRLAVDPYPLARRP